MPEYVNAFFEERLGQLLDMAGAAENIFSSAGLEHRIVGSLAVYLYVETAAPDAGRLTKDIDMIVRRSDPEVIAKAAEAFGFELRYSAGSETLAPIAQPVGRRVLRLIAVDDLGDSATIRGLRLLPPPRPCTHEAHQLPSERPDPPERPRRSRADHARRRSSAHA